MNNTNFDFEAVGTKFNRIDVVDRYYKNNCARMDSEGYGEGYMITIMLDGLSEEEAKSITHNPIEVRVYEGSDDMMVALLKFEGTELIFELAFNPFAYPDNRALQMFESNNSVFIYAIDSATGITKSIRLTAFPKEFSDFCKVKWTSFKLNNYGDRLADFYQNLTSKFTTSGLWRASKFVGKMGKI